MPWDAVPVFIGFNRGTVRELRSRKSEVLVLLFGKALPSAMFARVTYKTAWFMAHRIREAMREKHTEPMGGAGKPIPFDDALRRLVNAPPKSKKSGAGGGAERAKPRKARHRKLG